MKLLEFFGLKFLSEVFAYFRDYESDCEKRKRDFIKSNILLQPGNDMNHFRKMAKQPQNKNRKNNNGQ